MLYVYVSRVHVAFALADDHEPVQPRLPRTLLRLRRWISKLELNS